MKKMKKIQLSKEERRKGKEKKFDPVHVDSITALTRTYLSHTYCVKFCLNPTVFLNPNSWRENHPRCGGEGTYLLSQS